MSKNKSSKRWLQTQNKDLYVKKARKLDFRSRAIYKLQEIDEKDQLIKPNYCVVDLGSSPGSWSQYLSGIIDSSGRIIAIDILPMNPIEQVLFISGDFTDEIIQKQCLKEVGEYGADLVISDMAPNLTGIRVTDQSRNMAIAELVYDFSTQILKPGGDLLVKLFEGDGTYEYRQLLKEKFAKVLVRKPKASRDQSREFYVLARSYVL
ncbi:MAG: RlmE family RNA methyltransferase [Gammaproteobacteria bacterium]|jgi:23S rRNA (uridine2552-2'-O)-methyltransferase|nr:RlmE family RNA methyltransferase [Gammaproteobacteria bacterium]|tara:strand:+ start:150 stop:770 length:621 start_codon:yes stop_codon:yes gene_type:complete